MNMPFGAGLRAPRAAPMSPPAITAARISREPQPPYTLDTRFRSSNEYSGMSMYIGL